MFSILHKQNIDTRTSTLMPTQEALDNTLTRVLEEASNPATAIPIFLGGAVFKLSKYSMLNLGSKLGIENTFVMKGISSACALLAETSVFELSQRSVHSFENSKFYSSLWQWNGEQGIKNGILTSSLSFGLLRGVGHCLGNQNILVRHFTQDISVVAGQSLASEFGLIQDHAGSLIHKIVEAEITNLQMMASLSLYHHVLPQMRVHEISFDTLLNSYTSVNPLKILSTQMQGAERRLSVNELLLKMSGKDADEKSGVNRISIPERPLGFTSIEAQTKVIEFLDWVSTRCADAANKETIELIKKSIRVVQDPSNTSAYDYEIARRNVEALVGLQTIRDVYGSEILALEQFRKNFVRFNLVAELTDTPLRMSPADHKPKEISYDTAHLRAKDSLEIGLFAAGGSFESQATAKEILAVKPDENAANHFWFYQALQFASEVGARVRIKSASSLLESFDNESKNIDPAILEAAIAEMRKRGINTEAEQVLEIVIPYAEVIFGENKPYVNKAFLSSFIADIETATNGAVRLIDRDSVLEAPMIMRVPSLSLFQELIRQIYPENATTFLYMNGETSRDAMMKGREMGLAAVGMGFQPMVLGDIQIKVPPWIYTYHDVFHATMASKSSQSFRKFIANQYHDLKGKSWAEDRIGKQYIGFLLDMNFAEKGFFALSLRFINTNLQNRMNNNDISSKDFVDALIFLDNYQKQIIAQQSVAGESSPHFAELEKAVGVMKARVVSLQSTYRWLGLPGLKVRAIFNR